LDVKKELNFIQEVTLGLFNRKDTSFNIYTTPYNKKDFRSIDIMIVNAPITIRGGVLRLKLNYTTSDNHVYIELEGSKSKVSKQLPKIEAKNFLINTLKESEALSEDIFNSEDIDFDFYTLLGNLSYEMFLSRDCFELNGWQSETYLHELLDEELPDINVEYGDVKNTLHVHGGVGRVNDRKDLNSITTTIEIGMLPRNNEFYLGVFRPINLNADYSEGMHKGVTMDTFFSSVVEQYKGAWNLKKDLQK
jgi:hypothetical protein